MRELRQSVILPVMGGRFQGRFHTFRGLSENAEHLAVSLGDWGNGVPLVRVHSECLTGDVFGSGFCDCGAQLHEAIEMIAGAGGLLIYLRQEGRGIGLYNKLDAYRLQAEGHDTYEANRLLGFPDDVRLYVCAAEMLAILGFNRIRLLTNNPDKAAQLRSLGVEIVDTLPTGAHVCATNELYLRAKIEKSRHTIDLGHGRTMPRISTAALASAAAGLSRPERAELT